jgi:hypothetical protein
VRRRHLQRTNDQPRLTHLDNASSANRLAQAGEPLSWAEGLAAPRSMTGDFNDGLGPR